MQLHKDFSCQADKLLILGITNIAFNKLLHNLKCSAIMFMVSMPFRLLCVNILLRWLCFCKISGFCSILIVLSGCDFRFLLWLAVVLLGFSFSETSGKTKTLFRTFQDNLLNFVQLEILLFFSLLCSSLYQSYPCGKLFQLQQRGNNTDGGSHSFAAGYEATQLSYVLVLFLFLFPKYACK